MILTSGQTGFGEEMIQVESIEVHFTHLIWSSDQPTLLVSFLH